MNPETSKLVCRYVIASAFHLPIAIAHAELIETDQLVDTAPATTDRARLLSLMSRDDVSGQLQSRGVDPRLARDRIAAMTDTEVASLAGQIDALPAGGLFGPSTGAPASTSSGSGAALGFAVLAALLIVFLIYYFMK